MFILKVPANLFLKFVRRAALLFCKHEKDPIKTAVIIKLCSLQKTPKNKASFF